MDVGILCVLQNFENRMTDAERYETDMDILVGAEELGFDSVAVVEHHFSNYGMAPDNMQILSYLAARTSTIKLMTGAVILPWNNPLRVVEKMILLDHLSGGRALFGMGRGLARREYETFGIPMSEARDRFEEAAHMILEGLETGFVEGEGPYYRQKRTEVRPGPLKSFKDRRYCVAMSPESIPLAIDTGATMLEDSSDWSAMGIFDALPKIPKISRACLRMRKEIRKLKPDAIVYIDCPAFNVRLARGKAHRQQLLEGFPVLAGAHVRSISFTLRFP